MMNSILIDGKKLSGLIAEGSIYQTTLADMIGVVPPTISRWKKPGENYIRRESLVKLADAYGLSLEELLSRISAEDMPMSMDSRPLPGLSAAEQEMIDVYRALSPRDQAKAFLRFEEMVDQLKD